MIKEIVKFEWLGTVDWFISTLKKIHDYKGISRDALQRILVHPYKQYPYIDGGGYLMIEMGLLKKSFIHGKFILNTDNEVVKSFFLHIKSKMSRDDFADSFINKFLKCLTSDGEFKTIFNHKILKRDIHNNIVIERNILGPKYSQTLNLFLDFGVIYNDDGFKVENKFRKMLIDYIGKKTFNHSNTDIGIESEEFVLKFEEQRLGFKKDIERVSLIDDTAGYDIASFEKSTDQEFTRFIEVKSYERRPDFYWTRNEKRVAEYLKEKYYIYLVDRSQILDSGYTPVIIKNPSIDSLQNNWVCEVEQYFFRKI